MTQKNILKKQKLKFYSLKGLFLVWMFSIGNLSAQETSDYHAITKTYTLATPDVYNFEKYSLNPVNNYTGKQNVSIPIYTIKTGGLEYPLSLVYDAGGIKVDQLASDVGLGWNLTKTILTRTINQDNDFDNLGSKDERPDYNLYTQADRDADWQAKRDYNTQSKTGYFLQKLRQQKFDGFHQDVDFLPDVYHFYTEGFSTSFFFNDENTPIEINPKGTNIVAIASNQTFNAKRFKLGEYEYNIPTRDFFTIIITTREGKKYTFSDCDLAINQVLESDRTLGGDLEKVHSPSQISAWHVSVIEDTKTGKKINFVYQNTSSNPNDSDYSDMQYIFRKGAQRSFEYVEFPYFGVEPTGCDFYTPGVDNSRSFDLKVTARVDVQKKRLKKILFDQGEVYFNYNNESIGSAGSGRPDILNGDYVSQIYIKDINSKIINSFNLNYHLFVSNYNVGEFNPDGVFNTFRYNRLKLLSVQEIGKPAYKFSYEESIKLPPVNSFSVDFLGYYNNSPDIAAIIPYSPTEIRPNPTLYYYPNQFEKSLLPFPVSGMSYTTIPGVFNRQANDFAKAWSLTKVEYPTGGSSEYVYESNEFEIFGQTVKGGGIRLKKQILKDDIGGMREINYSYVKNTGGTTSGKLSSIPFFGHPTHSFFSVQIDDQQYPTQVIMTPTPTGTNFNIQDWKLYDKSNLNADITIGSYVGYSRVLENEVGNGRKESIYTSNEASDFQNTIYRTRPQVSADIYVGLASANKTCIEQFIVANSGFGMNIFTDNSYKRGKLLEENIFNETNQLLKKTKIDYNDFFSSSYDYSQGFLAILHTQNDANGADVTPFVTIRKNYKIAQFLPIKKTISIYDNIGLENKTESNLTYNQFGLLKTASTTNSNGDVKENRYYYPTDVLNANSLLGGTLNTADVTNYHAMANESLNNISEQIQVEDYTNNVLDRIIRKTYTFVDPYTFIAVPATVKTSKGSGSLVNKYTISQYETGTANPVEMSQENGVKSVLIWGYKKSKLIAKIDNIDYSSVPPATITNLKALSDADNDNCKEAICKEQLLRVALNNLRVTFPNAMITTYTHDYLVGVTSITNPRGESVYYEYDTSNRLKLVRDQNGNILSENEYNYKNQ